MDCYEPLLQNNSYNGGTWQEYDVDYEKVYEKKKEISKKQKTNLSFLEIIFKKLILNFESYTK